MKQYVRRIVIAAGHAIFLTLLSFWLLGLSFSYDNESSIISIVSIVKNVVLGLEDKPAKNDFLFVNVSYQKSLIPKLDEYGFEIGNEAITDREQLAVLLKRFSSNKHRYIVCDVFLDQPSPSDSLLRESTVGLRNVVFPYHNDGDQFAMPVIPVHTALSDYETDFGNFLKYSYLQHDTAKTIALAMYHDLYGGTPWKAGPFYRMNGHFSLSSFVTEFPVRQYDVFREDTLGYSSIHMQNLVSLPDEFFNELTRNRIIVIGDFLEQDMHATIYGQTAGPLIHLNAFQNLVDKRNHVSVWFLMYVVVAYFLFSWSLFSTNELVRGRWLDRIKESKLGFVFDYLKYAFFLLLMSVMSYLLFGIHLNILIISLYFSIIEYLVEFLSKRSQKTSEPV